MARAFKAKNQELNLEGALNLNTGNLKESNTVNTETQSQDPKPEANNANTSNIVAPKKRGRQPGQKITKKASGYKFPLRGANYQVELHLPEDLTHDEADRLAKFLHLLVTSPAKEA